MKSDRQPSQRLVSGSKKDFEMWIQFLFLIFTKPNIIIQIHHQKNSKIRFQFRFLILRKPKSSPSSPNQTNQSELSPIKKDKTGNNETWRFAETWCPDYFEPVSGNLWQGRPWQTQACSRVSYSAQPLVKNLFYQSNILKHTQIAKKISWKSEK